MVSECREEKKERKKKKILTHQIKVNGMINKVILSRLDIRRGGKVHTVLLTRILDLLPLARQAHHVLVKLLQVLFNNGRRVPRGITADEDRQHDVPVPRLDIVNHAGHLVQLFGANVRAVGEAKVDERVLALEAFLGELRAVLVDEVEGPADEGTAQAFGLRRCALAAHAVFFMAEVHGEACAGPEEEEACLP